MARRPAGVPREVVGGDTNLGPVFDESIAKIRQRMLPQGIDRDYDLAYEHFDLEHFALQAKHVLSNDVDPLQVFLANGAKAKASPTPCFDTAAYLARYPERRHDEASPFLSWLKHGRAAGEIADPAPGIELAAPVLGLDVAALAEELGSLRADVQQRLRTGRLGEMISKAAEIEPLVGDAWSETTRVKIPPFLSSASVTQLSAIHRCHQQAGFDRARVVIVVNGPRWGGGRRAEGHLAHAVAGEVGASEIVVVYTEAAGSAPAGRFPAGVREIDLATPAKDLSEDAAQRVLVELLRSLQAESIINVNSVLLYGALATYGKALAASERIFLVMFCNEQMATGNWVGLPLRYFYRCFDRVAGVITDSHYLADWLIDRHQLPAEMASRVHVLSAPVDGSLPVAQAPPLTPGRRPQIFWAGRFDRQKRIDIAIAVAALMPEADFRLWGEHVLNARHLGNLPDNVELHSAYAQITDLDLGQADAWLYTSGWDGVPSQLLEVAMLAVPTVGSLVGGVGEVLDGDLSWPISEVEDAESYARALREILADPAQARRKARDLRDLLLRERSAARYAAQALGVLLPERGRADVVEVMVEVS